jgi:hypothetical protein
MIENFISIDATNTKAPKLQTYIDAKKAFEEDTKTLKIENKDITDLFSAMQDFIDLKQIAKIDLPAPRLQYLKEKAKKMDKEIIMPAMTVETGVKITTMGLTIAEIDKKLGGIAKTTTNNAEVELNKNRTSETAKNFFEMKDGEGAFNAVFDDISAITTNNLETYTTAADSDKTK